jgi:hypothetical protein
MGNKGSRGGRCHGQPPRIRIACITTRGGNSRDLKYPYRLPPPKSRVSTRRSLNPMARPVQAETDPTGAHYKALGWDVVAAALTGLVVRQVAQVNIGMNEQVCRRRAHSNASASGKCPIGSMPS